MKTPFHIGQPIDNVLWVAKKTGRDRKALEITTEDGEVFRFDLDAKSARERRAKLDAVDATVGEKRIDLGNVPKVRYFYADCVLTFEKTRGLGGSGPLCYRVTEIKVPE